MKDPTIDGLDKLKLVMLFALRYEGDKKVETLKYDLEAEKVPNKDLIDLISLYAGKLKRKGGLFTPTGNVLEWATKVFKEAFKVVHQK